MKRMLSLSLAVIVMFCFMLLSAGCGNSAGTASKSDNPDVKNTTKSDIKDVTSPLRVNVGESLDIDGVKFKFVNCYEYKDYRNKYDAPKDGYIVYCLELEVENTSSEDLFIIDMDFNCFADDEAVDLYAWGDDSLSADLSPGRKASGNVYFEVPRDAQSIEVEYTSYINLNKKKAIFVVK